MTPTLLGGDDLLQVLAALANPIRLRILAQLASGRDYVSHLAWEIGVSRPLVHMHLQRLEAVGLVVGAPGWAQSTNTFGGINPLAIVNQPVDTSNAGVPIARPVLVRRPWKRAVAMPKSVMTACPSSSNRTLSGLTSRWMIPRRCA